MKYLVVFGLMMAPVILFAQGKAKKAHIKPDTTVYTAVDVIPEFPGGREKLEAYLSKMKIPPLDSTENTPGRVIIRIIVEKDGSLTHLKIVRPGNKTLDQAYLEYLSRSPKWKPGLLRGKPVRVAYSIPININLSSEE